LFLYPCYVGQAYAEAVEEKKGVLSVVWVSWSSNSNHEVQRLVDTGLNLGGFLCEAGRYQEAHLVFQAGFTRKIPQKTTPYKIHPKKITQEIPN